MASILLRFKNVRDNFKNRRKSQPAQFPTAETSRLGRISETGLLTELTSRTISSGKKKNKKQKTVSKPVRDMKLQGALLLIDFKGREARERGRKCGIYRT